MVENGNLIGFTARSDGKKDQTERRFAIAIPPSLTRSVPPSSPRRAPAGRGACRCAKAGGGQAPPPPRRSARSPIRERRLRPKDAAAAQLRRGPPPENQEAIPQSLEGRHQAALARRRSTEQ